MGWIRRKGLISKKGSKKEIILLNFLLEVFMSNVLLKNSVRCRKTQSSEAYKIFFVLLITIKLRLCVADII